MEETQTDAPEAADIETAPEPALWDLTEEEGALVATDPAGWWDAKVVGEIVSITCYANHSLVNRPAGQKDSADQTIVAPLGELIDRLIAIESHGKEPTNPESDSSTTEDVVLTDAPEVDPAPVVEAVPEQTAPVDPAPPETPKSGKGKKENGAGA